MRAPLLPLLLLLLLPPCLSSSLKSSLLSTAKSVPTRHVLGAKTANPDSDPLAPVTADELQSFVQQIASARRPVVLTGLQDAGVLTLMDLGSITAGAVLDNVRVQPDVEKSTFGEHSSATHSQKTPRPNPAMMQPSSARRARLPGPGLPLPWTRPLLSG